MRLGPTRHPEATLAASVFGETSQRLKRLLSQTLNCRRRPPPLTGRERSLQESSPCRDNRREQPGDPSGVSPSAMP